jgi:hypothetical protein
LVLFSFILGTHLTHQLKRWLQQLKRLLQQLKNPSTNNLNSS